MSIFGPVRRLLPGSLTAYLLGIILWVDLVKVAIAAADTPLCWLAVWATRRFIRRPERRGA